MSLSHQCSSALKKLHGCTNSVDKKLPPLTRRLEPFYQQSRYGEMSGATDLKLRFSRFLCFSLHINSTTFSRRICHDRRIIVFTVCSRKKIAYLFLPFTVSVNDLSVWERGTLTSSKVSPLFERYTLRKRRAASSGQFLYPRKFFLHPSIFVTFETMPMILLVSEPMDFVRAAYSL